MKFKPLRIFIFLAIECQTPCQAMGNISDGNQSSKNSKNSSIGLILKRINSSTTTEEWHSCFVSSRAGYCVFFLQMACHCDPRCPFATFLHPDPRIAKHCVQYVQYGF